MVIGRKKLDLPHDCKGAAKAVKLSPKWLRAIGSSQKLKPKVLRNQVKRLRSHRAEAAVQTEVPWEKGCSHWTGSERRRVAIIPKGPCHISRICSGLDKHFVRTVAGRTTRPLQNERRSKVFERRRGMCWACDRQKVAWKHTWLHDIIMH